MQFDKDGDDYVATGLTFPKLDRIKEEKAARAGTYGAAVVAGCVAVTTEAPSSKGAWHNSRPWCSS